MPINIPDGEYLTVAEAAKETGKTDRGVRKACQRGTVPGAVKASGRGWIIPIGALLLLRKSARGRPKKESGEGKP
jgi:hypothetical protein